MRNVSSDFEFFNVILQTASELVYLALVMCEQSLKKTNTLLVKI
jgi:hypothetical protein